jgi:dephospho-CoA kinase
MFEVLGVPVYIADLAAKRLYDSDEQTKRSLIETFGSQSYVNNRFNPSYLRNLVFGNPALLEKLNSIIHPATIRDANQWMARQRSPYVLKEAALIFESGSQRELDFIIGVTAPLETRIQRVMDRDHLSRNEVLKRMDRQLDEQIKMKLCDAILVNNDKTPLLPQVLAMHEKLLGLAGLS